MNCQECINWKCEQLTYSEFQERWRETIGGSISPGVLKRYSRKAEGENKPLESIEIGYKYCSKGVLSRFYIMKNCNDFKAVNKISSCPHFSYLHSSMMELDECSPIWKICISDSHGLSEVQGVTFVPGLYEDDKYMRIPLYGSTRPIVTKGHHKCSSCGSETNRAITIRLDKTFCCNKHYLEWWGKRYREEYKKLNG